ncbi:hypothetical protein KPH14_010476 [Odynerus spinipes]|uniref:ABC transporter domain-containing protein n=1 Tax=Odynerus spinipes TaxID=1348599 RepID=A0AAD9VSY3_9HYME|nr:hypothetical protein KPH14_010476 [Odynerus spinipes]
MDVSCSNDDSSTYRMVNDHPNVELIIDEHQTFSNGDACSYGKAQSMYIEFENLRYSVPNGKGKRKEIIENATGCFEPRKLTAVVGPSGAGKSTLLRIISGLNMSNVKGSIRINGCNEIDKDTFRKRICYIPQEFSLLPLLTTKETLRYAARLKLGQGHSAITSCFIVEEVAESLGLLNCLHTAVGKLSGGEKKRLSIGVEIVTKPTVLLLDEPTSGLDSASSNQVINLLHSMSRSGCTVACAVHQPSSQMISQFDTMIILDQGNTLYCGPREEVLNTFQEAGYVCPHFYNIAEFVLEVVTNQRGGDLKNLAKINSVKYVKWKSQNEYYRNGINDTSMEFKRVEMDETMTKLRFAAHIAVALLLGTIFYDFGNDANKVTSNISCIFFFLLFLFFANSMPVVQIFPIEASVFFREYQNHWYRLLPYYVSKILSDLPMQLLCPSCFFIIAYYMTGQPMESHRFTQAWLVSILLTILGQSVGIAVGAAFDTQLGTFLIPALSIPMFLFAGFFLKLREISVYYQPLCMISFFRYAFEGFVQAIYGSNRGPLVCPEAYCYWHSPKQILSMMDMPSVKFEIIVVVLIAWIFCLHVIIYAALRWKLYCIRK